MFGLGFGKLILVLIAGVAGWLMLRRSWNRYFGRGPAAPQQPPPAPRSSSRSNAAAAETMVRCDRCGSFVAQSARRCERADCPRPG